MKLKTNKNSTKILSYKIINQKKKTKVEMPTTKGAKL